MRLLRLWIFLLAIPCFSQQSPWWWIPSISSGGGGGGGTTPTVVQHISGNRDNTATAGTLTGIFPNPSLAGNCWIISFEHDSTQTAGTPTTDKADNFTAGPTITTNGQVLEVWFVKPTTGAQSFSMGAGKTGSLRGTELYHTTCTSDGSNTSATRSLNVTTTVSGDFLYQAGVDTSIVQPAVAGITKGVGYTPLSANRQSGSISQYQITSGTGSINAAFTSTDADTWESAAIALKGDSSGTAPSITPRIVSMQAEAFGTTTHTMQVPCVSASSNLLIGMWTSTQVTLTASTTSSPANTWNAGNSLNTNSEIAQVFYALSASCSNALTISPVYSGTDSQGLDMLVMLEVVGASPSHDVDSNSSGNQTVGGTLTVQSITPIASSGIVVNVTTWLACTATSVTPGFYGGVATNSGNSDFFAGTGCTSGTGASTLNEDDGRAFFYNLNTSAVSFVYSKSNTNGAVGTWNSVSSAFH